ncbi:MAG: linear amide C-N hydrolase [Clostridia bacterium]|nr:linear amide C-N hydrolase [Clostridia bacterium]
MKKAIKTVVIILAAALLIVLIGAWAMFGTEFMAANSVEKLTENFYSMEYKGDYGLDKFIEQGGASDETELANYIVEFLSRGFYKPEPKKTSYGCSTLCVNSPEGGMMFGRNFDWQRCTAMVIRTKPKNGYASISTSNLDFLGFGNGWLPEGMSNQFMSLAALYVPLDGMNEKGLCIADLVIDDGTLTNQNTEKPDLTTTSAIRLILDKAATVDEAIELLNQYDMHSSAGMQHHLSIADESGRAVVVEYVDNKMCVTETNAVTNFYLTDGVKYGIGSEQSHKRYDTLNMIYADCNGVMTGSELMDAMSAVSKHNYPDDGETTEWSVVFDTKNKTARYCRCENYGIYYDFEILK